MDSISYNTERPLRHNMLTLQIAVSRSIDFECEEEEVGGVQSDGSLFSEGGQGSGGVAGRKRLHSEAATAAANINLTEMPSSSRDAKCKQASNLHNEREKERRVTVF
jgi:hypothetical protein